MEQLDLNMLIFKYQLNAGQTNPHCSYHFNYHAKDVDDYDNAINNFEKIILNYDKNFLYEYFYMRYLHGFYLFPDELENDNNKINYQSSFVYENGWIFLMIVIKTN